MNVWIDIGLWVGVVALLFAAWPFLVELGLILEEIENEAIRKSAENERKKKR